MFSASFMPLQAGSWLISIFGSLGAMPSNLTVPFTVATVAGSIGVAAGAIAGCSADIVLAGCSSFLVQAAVSNKQHRASTLTEIIQQLVFLFIISFLLFSLIVNQKHLSFRAERGILVVACAAGRAAAGKHQDPSLRSG